MMKKSIAFAASILIIMGLTRSAAGDETSLKVAPKVGALAPPFELETPSGEKISLESFRGRPLILNFWATWCPPCRAEMPDLQAFYEHNQDRGVVVIGIDQAEDAKAVDKFLSEFEPRITYPILLDKDKEVSRKYRLFGLPSSFFIDRDGIIRAVWPGFMNAEVIERNATKIF
jgi:peroxiredoxin